LLLDQVSNVLGQNSTWLDTTRHVRASRDERVERDECVEPCFSNMADDEEAVVLACTSLVFCALSVHVNKTEKDDTLCG